MGACSGGRDPSFEIPDNVRELVDSGAVVSSDRFAEILASHLQLIFHRCADGLGASEKAVSLLLLIGTKAQGGVQSSKILGPFRVGFRYFVARLWTAKLDQCLCGGSAQRAWLPGLGQPLAGG